MNNCLIRSKSFDNGWNVDCAVDTDTGTRAGLHYVDLPEEATDDDIKAAIIAQYE